MQFKNNQFSLVSHTYFDYDCDAGKLNVNAGLKEVKFQFGDLEMGKGTFQMGVSHIYCNLNHIFDTCMGNNWKLNIQQYVIPYQAFYNLEGYQVGDYIYIDEYNHLHRFVQYDRNRYVDQSETGLYLIADNYTRQIKDDKDNCLDFDTQGRLKAIITMGRSQLLTKFIKYDTSGKLVKFYDSRKEEQYFKFEYRNNLLYKMSLIDKEIEKESVYYNYEGTNLQSVYTFLKDSLSHISMFRYDSYSNFIFATGTSNGRAVEIDYTGFQLKIREGISKINMKAVQVLEEGNYLVSDFIAGEQPKIGESCKHMLYIAEKEIYLGENDSLFDIIHDKEAILECYECFNINDNLLTNKTLISYFTSYTDVLTLKEKTYRYYKNRENTMVSQFEVFGNNLMTLTKDTGHPLMCDMPKEYTGYTLNGKRTISRNMNSGIWCLNTFNDVNLESDFKNNNFNNYYKSKGSCFLNYKLSFWLKHNSSNAKYMKVRIEYDNDMHNYKNVKYVDHLATNAWQKVEVDLSVKDDQQKNRLALERITIYIETDGAGSYEISNVRCDGSSKTILRFRNNLNIEYPIFPNYYSVRLLKASGLSETIFLGKQNFLTENDVLQSMINKETSFNSEFDFIYNNGKNRVANVTYIFFKVVEKPEYMALQQEYDCGRISYFLDLSTYNYLNEQTGFTKYDVIKGNLIKVSTTRNNKASYIVQDRQGRIIESVDEYGKKTLNEYDAYGNLLSTIIAKKEDFDSNNKFITDRKRFYLMYTYNDESEDGRNREIPVSIKNEECNIEYLLDSNNRLNGIKSGENSYQNYSYDPINRLSGISSENQRNQIEYDAYGNIKSVSDKKNKYLFDLDTYGNIKTTSIEANGTKQKIYEEEFESISSDILISKNHLTKSNNHIYYDEYGRPISIVFEENNGKGEVTFTYQKQGDIIGNEAYANPFNESPSIAQVKTLHDGYSNMETTFIYDNNNQKRGYKTTRLNQNYLSVVKENDLTTKYNIGTTEYRRFDIVNSRLEKVEYGSDEEHKFLHFSFEYEYHPIIGAVSRRKNNFSEVKYSYERRDGSHYYSMGIQEIKQIYSGNDFDYQYEYNQDMNLIKVFSNGVHKNTISYSYDFLGRIYKEGLINLYKDFEYHYTDFNRLSEVLLNGNSYKKFTYDSLGRITKCSAYGNTLTEYTYQGNNLNPSIIYKKGMHNACNFIRNGLLSTYGKYQYGYSASGLRTYKNNGSSYTWYYYDGNKLLGEDLPNGAKIRYFHDEQGIIGVRYYAPNGSILDYDYVKDGQNNVIAIMRGSDIVAQYRYDAWGNILQELKDSSDYFAVNNPIRYRSYYYDVETGYYYLQNRYYDPEIGAFISPDTVDYLDPETIGGLNIYTYCLNNPVMYVDPEGCFGFISFLIGSMVVGAIFGATTKGIKAYKEGERGLDLAADIFGGMILGAATGATLALGGAAGLATTGVVIAGYSLSTGVALGISVGAMAIASMASYSLDCAFSNKNDWNIGKFFFSGVQGVFQGVTTFGLAFLGGKIGLFNKLGNLLTPSDFFIKYGGMNIFRSIVWGSTVLVGETISRMIMVSAPAALIRFIIDLIFVGV